MKYGWVIRFLRKRAWQQYYLWKSRLSGRTFYTTPLGIKLGFINAYHHSIAEQMGTGYYDETPLLFDWYKYAKQADIIFDVGGFNGVYALTAKQANPGARIICFEPDPVNAAQIRANAKLNNVKLTLIEAAVSDHQGYVKFSADGSTGSRVADWGDTIPCVELSAFGSPDLLKLDIEGHEPEALRGANLENTTTIFIEENTSDLLPDYTKLKAVGLTAVYTI